MRRRKKLDGLKKESVNLERDCADILVKIENLRSEREALLKEIDVMTADYPSARDSAKQKLDEHLKSKNAGTILKNICLVGRRWRTREQKVRRSYFSSDEI